MGAPVITVKMSKMFQKHYATFPSKDRLKIAQFIHHLENFGFDGLKGRNKSSADVPVSDLLICQPNHFP